MIDELGLKGLSVGALAISDRSCHFFVNARPCFAKTC